MIQERRRVPRHRIETKVTVDGDLGRTIDFSASGVFFETDRRCVPGEDVALIFPLEQTRPGACVTCRARVLRIAPRGERFGVAVLFEPVAITVPG